MRHLELSQLMALYVTIPLNTVADNLFIYLCHYFANLLRLYLKSCMKGATNKHLAGEEDNPQIFQIIYASFDRIIDIINLPYFVSFLRMTLRKVLERFRRRYKNRALLLHSLR